MLIFLLAAGITGIVILFRVLYMVGEVFGTPKPKPQAEYMTTSLKPHWDN